MTIDVTYHEKKNVIDFCYLNINAKNVGDALKSNLKENNIDFKDTGVDIWVSADQFTSIDDIENKALKGFKKINNYESHEHTDPNAMDFGYVKLIPESKKQMQDKLHKQLYKASSQEQRSSAQSRYAKFRDKESVSSEELLSQHYKSKPSMQM